MIQKQFADQLIEYDKVATELAYSALPLEIGCSCNICRNFSAAISYIPSDVHIFLREIGIDPAKPASISDIGFEVNPGWCMGFYHIVGNYLEGDDYGHPVEHKIADGFQIGFTRSITFLPNVFPRPVLEMGFSFKMPWVLETTSI